MTIYRRSGHLVFVVVYLVCSTLSADIVVPNIFSDHMVLQRGIAASVWGWESAGKQVTVRFAGQEKSATADSTGRWIVRLDPLEACAAGRTLEIEGSRKIALQDVLVGDVWICSGQSNMEWPTDATLNAEEEIRAANYAAIRLFDVPGHTVSVVRLTKVPGLWQVCSPDSVRKFSAVGYFFSRHLHRETDIPIGMIGTNWGGTRIGPWTPPEGFRSVPELSEIARAVDRVDPATAEGRATWTSYLREVEHWVVDAQHALAHNGLLPSPVARPGQSGRTDPTAIYNGMVHPLIPYGIRGAIWYQGESNGDEGIEYFHKMKALVQGWRQVWNQGDFPIYFYFVQLANFRDYNERPEGGEGWARLREAQRHTLAVPHTGMAVITDIGEADDIHPRNKQDVGKRLALWALRDVCDHEVVVSGPLYRDMKREDGKIQIEFDHVGSGLIAGRKEGLEPVQPIQDGQLAGFAIAGADRTWHWAEASIDGQAVLVWSKEVSDPVAVRYAYRMNPTQANLYNREGLPASAFRTDNW